MLNYEKLKQYIYEKYGAGIDRRLWESLVLMDNPVLDQDHFRGYEPGTEAGSSAIAAEDVSFSRNTATPFQFRILAQESGGLAEKGNLKVQLQVSKEGGTFANVDASSSNVQSAADPNITDNAVTTNRLAGGTGTFVAGRFDEVDGLTNTNVTIAISGFTEFLFSVTIVNADVNNDDTLDFRLVEDDLTVFDNYNVTGRVTVIKAAGGLTIPLAFDHLSMMHN